MLRERRGGREGKREGGDGGEGVKMKGRGRAVVCIFIL